MLIQRGKFTINSMSEIDTIESYKDGIKNVIDSDYMLFFGEEKKRIIEYFIDACYNRDGKEEGIKKKILKAGYIV